MDLSNFWWQAPAAPPTGIGNSLRFRGAQFFTRTPASDGNRQEWTMSFWLKKAEPALVEEYFYAGSSNNFFTNAYALNTGSLGWYERVSLVPANDSGIFDTNALFRDPSAWYNFIFVYDSTNADQDQRVRMYVNGERADVTNTSYTIINFNSHWNSTAIHNLFSGVNGSNAFQGYGAKVHFIDGQCLDPTDFGEYDANGVWVPKAYTGTYGANGFYLDFSDPADIGADRSGNGNDWTPNGFELADQTSPNWDHIEDSPTQNFLAYNPLDARAKNIGSYLKGNLLYTNTSSGVNSSGYLTAAIPGPGRWAFDLYTANTSNTSYQLMGGVKKSDVNVANFPGEAGNNSVSIAVRKSSNNIVTYKNGNSTTLAAPWPGNNQWLTWLLDCRTPNKVVLRIVASDGTTYGSTTLDYDWSESEIVLASNSVAVHYDSGNMANAIRNALPGGYEYLNSSTFPAAPIPNGRDHFQVITDTGANILTTAQTAFPNGLWWIKRRDSANQHQYVDSINPAKCVRTPDSTYANYSPPGGTSSTAPCVAWCWNASQAPSNLTAGSIDASVAVNNTAGFSMGRYTGIGGTDRSIEHGLDQTPELVFIKGEYNPGPSTSSGFNAFFTNVINAGQYLRLNSDDVLATDAERFKKKPDNQFIWVGNGAAVNTNGKNYRFYAWHSVPGYSAFGSYTGNGNADGPFIYTGFRPALFIYKRITGTGSWILRDSTRDVSNPANKVLLANNDNAENTSASTIDFVSNGVKIRNDGSGTNSNNHEFIYMAFAENPFGGSNVAPANAR